MNTIDWRAEHERFERVALPFALKAARRAFKRWHERKRDDAEAEFMAKMWDQWARLLLRGKDPEPMLWPLIHWAKQWVLHGQETVRPPPQPRYRGLSSRHDPTPYGRARPAQAARKVSSDQRLPGLDGAGPDGRPRRIGRRPRSGGMTLEEYLAA